MTDPTGLDVLGRLLPSLALIVGALLLVRRWSQRGGARRAAGGVRVLARTGLSRGAVVAVVAVGSRHFLVGATDREVSLLGELDEGELAAPAGPSQAAATAGDLDPDLARATDGRAASLDRPRMGLVDRLRAMTVRTHLERPIRASSG